MTDYMIGAGVTGRGQRFAGRTSVDVLILVECEVGSAECAVVACALVPNRDVRCYIGVSHEAEKLARPIRGIRHQPIGLEAKLALGARDHLLGALHLVISAGRRGLHVDDHRMLDVDKVIEPVAELDALVGFRGPGRARVYRRNHFRRLAIGMGVFLIEGAEELGDCPITEFSERVTEFVSCHEANYPGTAGFLSEVANARKFVCSVPADFSFTFYLKVSVEGMGSDPAIVFPRLLAETEGWLGFIVHSVAYRLGQFLVFCALMASPRAALPPFSSAGRLGAKGISPPGAARKPTSAGAAVVAGAAFLAAAQGEEGALAVANRTRGPLCTLMCTLEPEYNFDLSENVG